MFEKKTHEVNLGETFPQYDGITVTIWVNPSARVIQDMADPKKKEAAWREIFHFEPALPDDFPFDNMPADVQALLLKIYREEFLDRFVQIMQGPSINAI